LALIFGASDIHEAKIEDLPILEAVLLLLGLFGLYVAARGTRGNVRLHAWTSLFAMFFTVLSYSGYACTEVPYDEEVYASYQSSASNYAAGHARCRGSDASNNNTVE